MTHGANAKQPRMTKSEVRTLVEGAIRECAEDSGLTAYLVSLLGTPLQGEEERALLVFERDFDLGYAFQTIIDPEFFKTRIGKRFGDLLDQGRWNGSNNNG